MDKENIEKLFSLLNERKMNNELINSSNDGRINSYLSENKIKNFLKSLCQNNGLCFEDSKERWWFDCKINGTPFNIKITNRRTSDNMSSKKGLVYCLTGKIPGITHQETIDYIKKYYNKEDHDYGFIVIDKLTETFYISSLKNINPELISPNGNNLPFQIYFGGLDNILNHSVENQDKEIINKFLQSWLKKINIDLDPLYDILNEI